MWKTVKAFDRSVNKMPKAPPLYTFSCHFSIIVTKQCCESYITYAKTTLIFREYIVKILLHLIIFDLFMAELEEKILNASEKKPLIWWSYIDDIFFIWEHGEESLEKFLNKLNSFHPTIKFTAEYSKETINF